VARFSQRTRSKVVTYAAALRLFASSFSHFSQLAEVVADIVFTMRKQYWCPPQDSDSGIALDARRIPAVIDRLPGEDGEAFDLMRTRGLRFAEATQILNVRAQE
jgi:hypothetical protein